MQRVHTLFERGGSRFTFLLNNFCHFILNEIIKFVFLNWCINC